MTWSLEEELRAVTSSDDLGASLARIGLLSKPGACFRLSRGSGWYPGGAETYVYRFDVHEPGRGVVRCMLKACAPRVVGLPIHDVCQAWLAKRALLQGHGVSTPHLYYSSGAVVCEEYIPYSMTTVLASQDAPFLAILTDLAHLVGVLERLQFRPTLLFSDLRSRGDDCVIVDFGEDLGSPAARASDEGPLFAELAAFLCQHTVMNGSRSWCLLRDAYLRALTGQSTRQVRQC